MNNVVRIERAWIGWVAFLSLSFAASRQGNTRESTVDIELFCLTAVPALETELSRFGGHDGGANDNSRYTDKSRDGEGIEVPDRHILGVGVQKKLMRWEVDLDVVRKYDALGAFSQRMLELLSVRLQAHL